eukprot:TRINITY_DN7859_c2_g1_i1.p1 TRINITY_DN7859_c2_g1~~TRINITY_DN7859_c2_g1_i1.p1  ORF type:complete len:280 (+),score=32.02 TRINITY_DN7859_c2_g1_i1:71-841(+)
MPRPCCMSTDAVADDRRASTAGHGIVCQHGLFSNLFHAFAEITGDFLEAIDVHGGEPGDFLEALDLHGGEHIDTVSLSATAGALLSPAACGMASQCAPTHALVSQAATVIVGQETTAVLSTALIAVSVGRFLCSDWMKSYRSGAFLVSAREQFCQGLHGSWAATIRTCASLPRLEDCTRRSSDALPSSQDVAANAFPQTETSDGSEVPELRLDPSDGGIYTYEEFTRLYRTLYCAWEIKLYWQNMCRPMRSRHGKP